MSGAASGAGHKVHGMGTALEAPTWPAITESEADAVLSDFPGAGRLIGLRWHSPRPFSAATIVQTGRGAFFLKRHHRLLRTPAGLEPEHRFIGHLRAGGISVPEVMVAVDGHGAVSRGDWTYELHRMAPGLDLYRERPSWTPFLSGHHAGAAGRALARLHRAAAGFDAAPRTAQPLMASFTILPAPDPLAAADAFVAERAGLAAYLADKPWRGELRRIFAALDEGARHRLANEPPLWTHNDWHPSNLLWSDAGDVRSVIDFGLATRTCALHDIATAIERTAVAWLRLGQGEDDRIADAGAAVALLAGYRSVLPLGADDIAAILALLPFVHVEFALSETAYFAGILSDPGQAAMAWDGYLIGHADWFLSSPGQEFLRQVGQEARA